MVQREPRPTIREAGVVEVAGNLGYTAFVRGVGAIMAVGDTLKRIRHSPEPPIAAILHRGNVPDGRRPAQTAPAVAAEAAAVVALFVDRPEATPVTPEPRLAT